MRCACGRSPSSQSGWGSHSDAPSSRSRPAWWRPWCPASSSAAGSPSRPDAVTDCGSGGPPSTVTTEEGLFDAPRERVDLDRLRDARGQHGPGKCVAARPERGHRHADHRCLNGIALAIDAGGRRWWQRMDEDRDDWILTLPTSPIEDLIGRRERGRRPARPCPRHRSSAWRSRRTPDQRLSTSPGPGDSVVGTVNAGAAVVLAARGNLTGTFEVNAGGLAICVARQCRPAGPHGEQPRRHIHQWPARDRGRTGRAPTTRRPRSRPT